MTNKASAKYRVQDGNETYTSYHNTLAKAKAVAKKVSNQYINKNKSGWFWIGKRYYDEFWDGYYYYIDIYHVYGNKITKSKSPKLPKKHLYYIYISGRAEYKYTKLPSARKKAISVSKQLKNKMVTIKAHSQYTKQRTNVEHYMNGKKIK